MSNGAPDCKRQRRADDDAAATQPAPSQGSVSPHSMHLHAVCQLSFRARLFAAHMCNRLHSPLLPLQPPAARPLPPPMYGKTLGRWQRLKALGCAIIGMLALRLSQGSGGPDSCNSPVKYRMLEAQLRRVGAGRAAETPEALFEEGRRLYAAGRYAAAASKLGAAVKGGHLRAHAMLAWLLLFGRQGVRRRKRKALRLAEAGAQSGCCDCSGVAAYCHAQGYGGVRKDEASALQLARASAAAGSRYQATFLQYKIVTFGQVRAARDGHAVPVAAC